MKREELIELLFEEFKRQGYSRNEYVVASESDDDDEVRLDGLFSLGELADAILKGK